MNGHRSITVSRNVDVDIDISLGEWTTEELVTEVARRKAGGKIKNTVATDCTPVDTDDLKRIIALSRTHGTDIAARAALDLVCDALGVLTV